MTIGQLIEIFYIGKVGKLELAAITFMVPISMSLNALTRGIGIGAATIIARSMGAGNRDETAGNLSASPSRSPPLPAPLQGANTVGHLTHG